MNVEIKKDVFNDAYLPLLNNESDVLILYGGSSSGKSVFQAQRVITNLLQGGRNYLALRKVGNTIRDSIFPELLNVISTWNLESVFDINRTEKEITCKNGYKIICRGMDNPEKIKSIRTPKGVITDIWMEESTEFEEHDFNQLEHRLRGKSQFKKQITMTFNPISQLHWIKRRFFDTLDNRIKIIKSTYKDNKFLNKDDIERIEKYKDIDEYYYNVYALGEWGVLGNLIFNNWYVEDLSNIQSKFNSYYYGLDFGFSSHPSAIVKVAKKDNNIYILQEHYQKGMRNNELADVCKKLAGFNYVYCDCAEPKSITELRAFGVNAIPVQKGKDSVSHGIQWLKQHKIIIDKYCINTINEMQTYKFREVSIKLANGTKTTVTSNEPVDYNNHIIDAIRYALEQMMLMYKKSGLKASDFGL